MKRLKVIIVGCGNRGQTYSLQMDKQPEKYQIVGVADLMPMRVKYFKDKYSLSDDVCFNEGKDLLSKDKFADICIISTSDDSHYEMCLLAIEKGYDILLEKPVACSSAECLEIMQKANKKNVKVLVCTVLRHNPFFLKFKTLITEGYIGDVVSIQAVEAVGNTHMSHSFVRGNWHSTAESTPMLIAKSCHDIDYIQWLVDSDYKYVSSFGSLKHFNSQNAPEGAPIRCSNSYCPVRETCPYNCIKIYYDNPSSFFRKEKNQGKYIKYNPTDQDVMDALNNSDYGLCVYHANNDVVDNQVVSFMFKNGVTGTFAMNAFNRGGRYLRVYGTMGELHAFDSSPDITYFSFATREQTKIPVQDSVDRSGGHGGGDIGIINSLYDYVTGEKDTSFNVPDITVSAMNTIACFAAEEARLENKVIDMDDYMNKLGLNNNY